MQEMPFAPTSSAAFIGVIFVQPPHCINKQLPLSVGRNRKQVAPALFCLGLANQIATMDFGIALEIVRNRLRRNIFDRHARLGKSLNIRLEIA